MRASVLGSSFVSSLRRKNVNLKLLTPMKNKTGKISGFILGMTGFLLMFKIIILDHTPPEDELAPGIVVIASVLNGLLFAFIGSRFQNHFVKKIATPELDDLDKKSSNEKTKNDDKERSE